MKPSDIKVGKTYRNRGKWTTRRKVLAMTTIAVLGLRGGVWCRPEIPGVQYEQNGSRDECLLSQFAKWAGGEVEG
jgi:hypothetical protein